MKKILLLPVFLSALSSTTFNPAVAQEVLTGDTRLACEAILCLSSGVQPSECTPSLDRYFGISFDDWLKTVRARLAVLDLCPVSNQTPQMTLLINAISNGAGRCDATSLNATLRMWCQRSRYRDYGYRVCISDTLPKYCSTYFTNAYTDFSSTAPRYVGTPDAGGYWVEAKDYDAALASYKATSHRTGNYWWQ
jgi:hypothetical protein